MTEVPERRPAGPDVQVFLALFWVLIALVGLVIRWISRAGQSAGLAIQRSGKCPPGV